MSEKLLILVRGLPGSGRSQLAFETWLGYKRTGVVFATDDFFLDANNNYVYDPTKLQLAHSWNLGRTRESMQRSVSPILIDNTFSKNWEARKYFELALVYGYEVRVKQANTRWAFNPEECARRTKKGLTVQAIDRILFRWDKEITKEKALSAEPPEIRKRGYKHPDAERIKEALGTPLPQRPRPVYQADQAEQEFKKDKLKRGAS